MLAHHHATAYLNIQQAHPTQQIRTSLLRREILPKRERYAGQERQMWDRGEEHRRQEEF
jgi:hypothetical protein